MNTHKEIKGHHENECVNCDDITVSTQIEDFYLKGQFTSKIDIFPLARSYVYTVDTSVFSPTSWN